MEGTRTGRALAVLLAAVLLCTMIPTAALAQEADGLCPHHTAHTASCGYAAETAESAGAPCAFVCAECEAEQDSVPETEPVLCVHGAAEDCTVCAVQALIDALPAADALTAEEAGAAAEALAAVDAAEQALTEEQRAQLDRSRYAALSEAAAALRAEDEIMPAADIGTNIPNLGIGSSTAGGVQFKSGSYYKLEADGRTVTETQDTEDYNLYCELDDNGVRLTLKDAQIQAALYVPGGTAITLIGDNSIEGGTGIQVQTAGDLSLYGGSLEIKATTECVLNQNGACTIDGTTLKLYNGAYALNIEKDLTVHNAVIQATGSQPAMSSDTGSVTISGNSAVQVVSTIEADQKVIIQDTAQVDVRTDGFMAVNGGEGVEVLDSAYLYAFGSNGGINSFYGSVVIDGTAEVKASKTGTAAISVGLSDLPSICDVRVTGELTVNGYVGIGTMTGDIEIDGGTVRAGTEAPCGKYGLFSRAGNISIENGADVRVHSAQTGIEAHGDTMAVADSTVEVTAAGGAFPIPPVLNYAGSGAEVYAGDSRENASLVAEADITDALFSQSAYIKLQPHEHLLTAVEAKDAACETDGHTAYWTCTVCGKLFADENAAKEIALADTVVEKLGHAYKAEVTAPTCTEKGFTTHTCTRCGDTYRDAETAALGHTETVKNARPATCTAEGYTGDTVCAVCGTLLETGAAIPLTAHRYEDGHCTVCGAAEQQPTPKPEGTPAPSAAPDPEATPAPSVTPAPEATPAPSVTPAPETTPAPTEKPAVDGPQTGDTTPYAAWLGLSALSAAALGIVLYGRKKHSR